MSLIARSSAHVLDRTSVGLCRLITGATPRWIGCEPLPTKRIYFANHSSHLDFLAIWSALPPMLRKATHPVAAHDYWTKTKFREYLASQVFGAILVDRQGAGRVTALRKMASALETGASLIMFPEGRRVEGDGLIPFRSGLYFLAKQCPEAELIPVWIDNLNRVLPRGEFLAVPFLSSVSFGAPVKLCEGERRDEFLERAKIAVQALQPD